MTAQVEVLSSTLIFTVKDVREILVLILRYESSTAKVLAHIAHRWPNDQTVDLALLIERIAKGEIQASHFDSSTKP